MTQSIAVLVTGSAGRIGRAVTAELQRRGHRVRGFDRVPSPGIEDSCTGDLTRVEDVRRAVAGREAVIHLAATPDEDDFISKLLPNNIVAFYHILEEARLAGARRVILASTGQVVRGHAGPFPITSEMLTTPRNWYASTKIFAEAAGQAYAFEHGLSVIVARCGWCPRTLRDVKDLERSEFGKDVYLSPGDAGRFFACAVEARDEVRFATVFAISRHILKPRYDVGTAAGILGYEPRDQWPQGIELVTEP